MDIRKDILWRTYLCFIGIVLLCVLILGKVLIVQKVQGGYWKNMSDSLHQRIVELDAERGTIYSEDGQMLSASIPEFDIYIDFKAEGLRAKGGKIFKEKLDSFSIACAALFGDKPAEEYKALLKKEYKDTTRYFAFKKKLSFEQYKQFRQMPLVRLGKNKSGVIVEQSTRRMLPFGNLANRTIGLSREYLTSNGKVKKLNVGLEKSYDTILSGKSGQRLVRYAAGGALPIEGSEVDPINGKDIYTTIDVAMQDIAQNALFKMMDSIKALHGTCIVMETKTGKVKAIANLGQTSDGGYAEMDNYALRVSEPGSTIKLATLLSVLDAGSATIDDEVMVGGAGRMQVGPRMVTDAERSPKAMLRAHECFAHSSNVGMSKLAFAAFGSNSMKFKEYLQKYRLLEKLPIDLADLPRPRIAPLEKKTGGVMNMVTMSFGYAIQVSPLHTLNLYNAVANNGKMMKPYLVNEIRQNGVIAETFMPVVLDNAIAKPRTIQAAKKSMEEVVTDGTARRAFAGTPFAVAGKTGTAHVADGAIKYSHRVYQASFVGYFPADNPQYSCIVVVRTRPGSPIHYGGLVAAPVFKEVALKLYGIYVNKKKAPQQTYPADSSNFVYAGKKADFKQVYDKLKIPYKNNSASSRWAYLQGTIGENIVLPAITSQKNVVPDVKGMTLKNALEMLESRGLKVAVNGAGRIVGQSLEPGTSFNKGQIIKIELI